MTSAAVLLADRWLRVPLGETTADFHYRWLRHACDQDRHPSTGERIVCSSELPHDLRADAAWLADGKLHVRWSHDGRISRYDVAWLDTHAYARAREASAPPAPPSRIEAFEIDGSAADLDACASRAVGLVRARGAAVVRGASGSAVRPEDDTDRIISAFAARGLSVVGTHFGRIEDLRTDNTTNQNTDQLGYTDAAVELHTDQPFLEHPPRYQMLQSIRAADVGGENAIVDGLAASELLRSEDRHAWDLLRKTFVTFHRRQLRFERTVRSPILRGDGDGFQIRYSYFTLAPHRIPFEEMEAFYAAYDKFARLVRSPANQLRFLLQPGDFLLYDNHRMLHARTGFRGPRWMRGVYFDSVSNGTAL